MESCIYDTAVDNGEERNSPFEPAGVFPYLNLNLQLSPSPRRFRRPSQSVTRPGAVDYMHSRGSSLLDRPGSTR